MKKSIGVLLFLVFVLVSETSYAQTQFLTLSKHQIAGGLGYQHHAVSTSEGYNGVFGYSGHIAKASFFYAYQKNLIFSAAIGFTAADTQDAPPIESALYSDAAIVYTHTLEDIGIGFFAKGHIHSLIKGETETYPYMETYALRAGGGMVYQKLSTLRPFLGVFYENRNGHLSTGFQVVANVSDNYVLTEAGISIEIGEQLNIAGSVEVPLNAGEVVIRIGSNYKF